MAGAGHNSGVESEIAAPAGDVAAGSAGSRDEVRLAGAPPRGSRGAWWLVTVLAVGVALVAGGSVQHVFDQRNAARTLYRTQVLTTVSRFLTEADSQFGRLRAQRSAVAFGDLAGSISADEGINGAGALHVSLGAGSAAPADQIAFSATVASPYASTTFAMWDIHTNGGATQNQGVCVLWSSLLGAGRATTALNLGGGAELQPCSPSWWAPGPVTPRQPRLGLAGIPRSPR
jgi:hypothetical protein